MTEQAPNLASSYLHVENDERTTQLVTTDNFWADLANGQYPQLEHGRLMASFEFDSNWHMWERHPAGEEVVVLISGAVRFLLEEPAGIRELHLTQPGDFALVPPGIWHTARTDVPTRMLFLTPGAGTEHRPDSGQAGQ